MNIRRIRLKAVFLCALAAGMLLFTGGFAEADVKAIKVYKQAFPGTKPKCLFCHTDKIPKKGDGKHDLNGYGAKVKELSDGPATKEVLEQAGSFEDFESNQTQNSGEQAVEKILEEQVICAEDDESCKKPEQN